MSRSNSLWGKLGAIACLYPIVLCAQTTWSRLYGGELEDWAQCVLQTSDDGYIVTGGTKSFGAGESDLWLLKTDSLSDTLWTHTFGGTKNDYGLSVLETSDGAYTVLGATKSYGAGGSDIWLLKVAKNGAKMWERTFGGSNEDLAFNFKETSDGGFIIVGETHSYGAGAGDLWLLKTNSQGNTIWSHTFGGDSLDWGEDVYETSDGGFIVTGGTRSFGVIQTDLWLLKLSSSGNQEWSRTYGWRSWEWGKCIRETPDGAYIIAGPRDTTGAGMYDVWLLKTNSSGDTLWTHKYGGSSWDWINSVDLTSDGGYAFTGETKSFGKGNYDLWLYKTNNQGDSIWASTYGDTTWEWGSSIQGTSDAGYVVAGATSSFGSGQSDLWLLKTDSAGKVRLEVSPTRILRPNKNENVYRFAPSALFTNLSTDYAGYPYAHCKITDAASQELYYHDSIRLTSGIMPWETLKKEFVPWVAQTITQYTATFYASALVGDSLPSRPMSVSFRWTGVEEPVIQPSPTLVMVKSLGPELIMRYSNYPSGFCAEIFDAAGRRVDKFSSNLTSGTISWGKGNSSGVYFIRTNNDEAKIQKMVLVK